MAPPPVDFVTALIFWLKLGCISFGGPAGQIALMHEELVVRRRWIAERRFLHALNYCMVLPGPEAQQLATYIGWLMHRTWGGLAAGVLFVLPSLLLLIALSWLYLRFGQTTLVAGLFLGIKPAVTAIVLHAAYRIGGRVLHHPLLWAIAGLAFVALFILGLPFPLIIVTAAVLGWLGQTLTPAIFAHPGGHRPSLQPVGPAWIDDNSPTPDHARYRRGRLLALLAVGLLLWAVPMALLLFFGGSEHILTRMGLFFTQAALLTFGGAYAVLPYVFQGAVEQYSWLTAGQMIDGLALGETTPGPLIMVVAFVGYVGGAQSSELLALFADNSLLAGTLAAALVTWFTFLPSFIFIFAGGPLVESTHHNLKFSAPLTAITAAVVGVILNLALFFAYHVLWPQGMGSTPLGGFDFRAALIGLVAALALFRYQRSVLTVIAGCALLGLLCAHL